ncbi:PREDICTED: probable serine/threonine-protein kinase DDB_G0276461 [Rhagoletis zephyria]|nr:PREDICTED: probable serine/threonine-protein kinase DDB_G0276461 [Rhagoletis zephyria]
MLGHNGDISPLSSSNSFSSVDTNQTLLNSIANQAQLQHQQSSSSHILPQLPPPPTSNNSSSNRHGTSNRSYRTKYSQFMIITPAVSIDRDYEHDEAFGSGGSAAAALTNNFDFDEDAYCNDNNTNANANGNNSNANNGNIFRMSLLQNSSSIDSGNSSDSSFRSNYNPYLHHSRQHLLPKGAPHFYTFSSWRWCTLICAAMRCFGGGHSSHAPYSTSFARPPYQRSRSSGAQTTRSSQPHRRLRSSSFTAETAFEHFSAPFKARKTRDHLNNITYEL